MAVAVDVGAERNTSEAIYTPLSGIPISAFVSPVKVVNLILETINEMDIDYREIYTKLFFNKSIPVPFKLIVNKYSNTHNNCLVDTMHFMGLVFEGIQELQKYASQVKK